MSSILCFLRFSKDAAEAARPTHNHIPDRPPYGEPDVPAASHVPRPQERSAEAPAARKGALCTRHAARLAVQLNEQNRWKPAARPGAPRGGPAAVPGEVTSDSKGGGFCVGRLI